MALVTAADWIYTALRQIGQLRPGFKAQPELMQDGLDQWMLAFDAWNMHRTLNYTNPDFIFPVNGPGHGSTGNGQTFGGQGYEIGPTARDFQIPFRPVDIVKVQMYLTQQGPFNPVRSWMSRMSLEDYYSIAAPVLPVPITVSNIWAYDAQNPNGVLWIWPQLYTNSLEIFTWGSLVPPLTLSTVVSFPTGYADAIIKDLAVRLYPLCTKDFMPERRSSQLVRADAKIAREEVQHMNRVIPKMKNDFSGGCNSRNSTGVADFNLLFTGL
jgi:hypothetical protein